MKIGNVNTIIIHLKRVFYGVNLIFSLRILISLLCMTFIPWALGRVDLVIPTTLGVMAAAVSDVDDAPIGRLRNFFITSICFLVASFSVELLFPYFWLFLIGLILSTFGFTLLGILGTRYAVVSFGSLLIASYTMIGYHMYTTFFVQPFYLMIGVVTYNVIALLDSFIQPIRSAQNSLAICFYELSNYLNCKSTLFDPDEQDQFKRQFLDLTRANRNLIEALNDCKPLLFNRLRTNRNNDQARKIMNYYFVAQDIHERANASHVQYHNLSQQLKHSDVIFRFARILSHQALACSELANSIRQGESYQHNLRFKSDFLYLREAIDNIKTHTKQNRLLVHSLWNLFYNLQAIDALLATIDKVKSRSDQKESYRSLPRKGITFSDKIRLLKQQLTVHSPLFRHAIRISVVLAIDYLIIQFTQLQHGYWIMMTSLLVCQPNYTTTKHRLKFRIIGTVLGTLLGLPLTYLFPNIEAQLFLIAISGWLFFIFKNTQYAFGTIFITLMVFFSFGLVGESTLTVALYRLIATFIGCGIAYLGVTFLWPDWKFRSLPKQIKDICCSNSNYLSLISQQYQHENITDVHYILARRAAYETDIGLFNLMNIMATEPHTNASQIDDGFRLLMINHNLLSFMSTLGPHRRNQLSKETLTLFDESTKYIVSVLTRSSLSSDPDEIKKRLDAQLDKLSLKKERETDLLVIQQLQFILDLLPEFMQIVCRLEAKES